MSDAELVVIAVVAFLALLAIVSLVRVLMRRNSPWRRYRVGFFVERDVNGNDEPS